MWEYQHLLRYTRRDLTGRDHNRRSGSSEQGASATIAYACVVRGIGKHVTLFDVAKPKLHAEVHDLNHGLCSFLKHNSTALTISKYGTEQTPLSSLPAPSKGQCRRACDLLIVCGPERQKSLSEGE